MIRPLRIAHRRIFLGLAIVLPVLYILAVLARTMP